MEKSEEQYVEVEVQGSLYLGVGEGQVKYYLTKPLPIAQEVENFPTAVMFQGTPCIPTLQYEGKTLEVARTTYPAVRAILVPKSSGWYIDYASCGKMIQVKKWQ